MKPFDSVVRSAGALAVASLAVGACIDTSGGYAEVYMDSVTGSVVDQGGESQLTVDVAAEFYSDDESEFQLQSARLTVRSDGSSTVIPNPSLDLSQFPIRGDGQHTFRLTAPSPIPAPSTLPEFCSSGSATVDVEVRFYVPTNDRDLSVDPPIVVASGTGSLVPPGAAAPPSGVFQPTSVNQIGGGVAGEVDQVLASTARGGSAFFAIGPPSGGARLYVSDASSVRTIGSTAGSDQVPALSTTSDGRLIVAGANDFSDAQAATVDVTVWSGAGVAMPLGFAVTKASASDTVRVTSVVASEGPSIAAPTLTVALAASGALDFGNGVVLSPPADKYFGSYLVTLDLTNGAFLDAKNGPGDVQGMVDLGDGQMLVAYGDLPPIDSPRQLHVERTDALGAPVWSAAYPMLTYSVDLSATPEGGALAVALDETGLAQRTVALRIDDQGAIAFAHAFSGVDGSGAALADGRTLVAFVGASDVGAPDAIVSTAAAPTLVELDGAGNPTRALALGCGGSTRVRATDTGDAALALVFSELASIGPEVYRPLGGPIVVARLPGGG